MLRRKARFAEALVVQPGDTLIVRMPSGITHETADRVIEMLGVRLPGVKVAVVAAEQIAVLRSGRNA